jgi:hypothetical protein
LLQQLKTVENELNGAVDEYDVLAGLFHHQSPEPTVDFVYIRIYRCIGFCSTCENVGGNKTQQRKSNPALGVLRMFDRQYHVGS